MVKTVFTGDALPPLPVYSQAKISENKVYASGSIGCTREMKLVEGGVKAQTRAAIENMRTVLKAAGSDLQYIIKVNLYVTDIKNDFVPMNEVYAEFFPSDPPARTCVGVAALPLGAAMEIECVAEIPQ